MTVKELIEFLLTQPMDRRITYSLFSEQCLLELKNIEVRTLCEPRPDGWVHEYRPDKPTETHVAFPGN